MKNGNTYYDHALTKIEKTNHLRSIDEIKRPFASKEISKTGDNSIVLSECKDKSNVHLGAKILYFFETSATPRRVALIINNTCSCILLQVV